VYAYDAAKIARREVYLNSYQCLYDPEVYNTLAPTLKSTVDIKGGGSREFYNKLCSFQLWSQYLIF
jgi:hypothetical protein